MNELFEVKYKHSDLIPIAYKWVLKSGSCGVAFKELNSDCCNGEYPDVIGFYNGGSVLIEVKVSRSDFLSDKKKKFRIKPELGMGTKRYYMCPSGLIKVQELPEGWGLIYVNQMGKATKVHQPKQTFIQEGNKYEYSRDYHFECNKKAEHELMYSALRRLHIKGHIDCIYDKNYNYNHKEL